MRRCLLLLASIATLGLTACSAAEITGPTNTIQSNAAKGLMGSGS